MALDKRDHAYYHFICLNANFHYKFFTFVAMAQHKVSLKPLFGYVLVKPLKPETVTSSGIVLPDTSKEKPQIGEVIAVGEGEWNEDGDKRIPMEVKVGDKVVYKKWGGNEFKYEGEEYMLIEQKDIMAIQI